MFKNKMPAGTLRAPRRRCDKDGKLELGHWKVSLNEISSHNSWLRASNGYQGRLGISKNPICLASILSVVGTNRPFSWMLPTRMRDELKGEWARIIICRAIGRSNPLRKRKFCFSEKNRLDLSDIGKYPHISTCCYFANNHQGPCD